MSILISYVNVYMAEDVEPDYEWREILMLSWEYPKIKAGIQVCCLLSVPFFMHSTHASTHTHAHAHAHAHTCTCTFTCTCTCTQVIAERMNHEINDVQYLPDVNGQVYICTHARSLSLSLSL